MTMATSTNTSLENITSFHLCYFAIYISTPQTCTKTTNYPGTKLVGESFELRKRMKNSPSCVHVLHRTLNFVISRCCLQRTQRNEPKFKTHVQGDCFSSLNLLFCGIVVAVAALMSRNAGNASENVTCNYN